MTRPDRAARFSWWLWVAVAVLGVAMLRGIFPFSSAEGDEQTSINGLVRAATAGERGGTFLYDYPYQPGTFILIRTVHAILGYGFDQTYYALSALAAILGALAAALLVRRLLGLSFAASLVLILLCQEAQTASFYANSSTFGGLMGVLALLVVASRTDGIGAVTSGILLGLAGWFRMDSLVLAPAVLVLAMRQVGGRRGLTLTGLAAAASVLALFSLWAASGLSPTTVFRTYAGDSVDYVSPWMTLSTGLLLTSYAASVLSAVGIAWSLARREVWVAGLVVAVLVPEMILYWHDTESPKYLYYLVPVLTVAAGYVWRELSASDPRVPCRRLLLGACVVATLAEQVTSLRTSSVQFRRYDPQPTLATLFSFQRSGRTASWAIGVGELLPDSDGFRARTGGLFAGAAWSRRKQALLDTLPTITSWVDRPSESVVLTSTYLSLTCVEGRLLALGYRLEGSTVSPLDPNSHTDRWQKAGSGCTVAWINMGPDAHAVMAEYLKGWGERPYLFVNDLGENYAHDLLEGNGAWTCLSATEDGLITLYVRDYHKTL